MLHVSFAASMDSACLVRSGKSLNYYQLMHKRNLFGTRCQLSRYESLLRFAFPCCCKKNYLVASRSRCSGVVIVRNLYTAACRCLCMSGCSILLVQAGRPASCFCLQCPGCRMTAAKEEASGVSCVLSRTGTGRAETQGRSNFQAEAIWS